MIEYRRDGWREVVLLEGRIAGFIVPYQGGHQYRPRGTRSPMWGEVFATVEAVKASLESE